MDSASATPRRSARIPNLASTTPSQSSPPPSPKIPTFTSTPTEAVKMTARRSPFLPTSLELVLLSVYPTVLLVGSLFALLDPTARAAPYNAATQSHFADTAPSYFATKGNIFNKFFVKQGWAWFTFSYLFFLFTHPATGPPGPTVTPKRLRGISRYAIVTAWWIFTTQWFFGPAIIDRSFRLTGGACELVRQAEAGSVDMDKGKMLITGAACKAVGGSWTGGHDISGHVFLLVLGSMFLFEEVLHVVLNSGEKEERTIQMPDGAIKSAQVEAEFQRNAVPLSGLWTLGAKIVLGVAGLSLYMLLMTAAYFHTWFEKLTGLAVALTGIFVVYFLPRAVPALRSVIGMPGV